MLPEEREDVPLGGGRPPARGALVVARQLAPIASAVILALIAVLLGIVVRQGEVPVTHKAERCDFSTPVVPQPPFAPHTPILLSNGLVWLGAASGMAANTDVLLLSGKISQIGSKITPPPGATVIQLNGAVVTPGVVDLHSHSGVYSYPEDIYALADGNEMTNPTFPQMRAIDGFDPQDFAIPWIRQGGTTTAQVMPGSGNVMGGEAMHVKFRVATDVEDFLLLGGPPAEKMAVGENPKHVYGPMGQTPMTRMGTAWLLREKFAQAQQLIQQQEEWCATGKQGPMPSDLSLQALTEILRGERTLNIHGYQEFGFQIGAFHHALEAWMIPDIIKANNITVATFADLWGFKWEAFQASVWGPQILSDAGVKTCLKSDHGVTDSHFLMWMAAKAAHYSMQPNLALASITSVPAAAIGYQDRIGSLKVGLDADVVVWDRHPLLLGAQPNYVFIEGQTVFTNPTPTWGPTVLPAVASTLVSFNGTQPATDNYLTLTSYSIQGALVWDMTSNQPITGANIVVQNGMVQCVGLPSTCPTGVTNVYQVTGTGIAPTVTPGFIESDTIMGQSDIDQEPITQDGTLGIDGDYLYAADGIAVQSKHTTAALKGGVTISVNAPMGSNVISGFGVAWRTSGTVLNDALVKEVVGLHVSVGQQAKSSGPYASVSGQISELRLRFQAAQAEYDLPRIAQSTEDPSAFAQVLLGQLPLVAHVGQADYMASLLRLQTTFNFTMVIIGGNEGWVVADLLAANDVTVIVSPPLCTPMMFWAIQRCDNANMAKLAAAGVRVGLSTGNYENSRHIRWDAGWQVEYGVPYYTALAGITSTVADTFGLANGVGRIIPGTPANFVLWDQDPLTLLSRPQLVATGTNVLVWPRQF